MKYKLIDLLDFKTQGVNTTTDKISYVDKGYKIVQAKNIAPYNITFDDSNYIDEETFNRIKDNHKLHKGEVLYTNIGSQLGNSAIYESDEEAIITWNVMKLIPNKEIIDNYYLCYLLNSNKSYIKALNTSSTMPFVSGKELMNVEFDVPDLITQKKIVKILKDIEDKIKINNEINNNLYEISKQLLLKYIDDNSSSEEVNISELLNVFTGKKNANETSPTGKYKFFSCAPESLLSDTYLYDGAAIIVAGNGAYTGRTRFYDGKFELYQRTYGLTLKDGFDKDNIYGLYVFMKTIFEPDKMGGTHGSAIPYIVLSDLTDYKLKYNKTEFDKFSNLVSSNIKMIQENEKSNEELSQLRDTLLLKLMNGEIDLNNIEI